MAKHRETSWPPLPDPLTLAVVDNHTHLESVLEWDAAGWLPDRPHDRPDLADHLERAVAAGVDRLVQVGCDLDSIAWTDALLRMPTPAPTPTPTTARPAARLVGAVAIHPNEAVLHAGIRELAPDGLAPDPRARHEVGLEAALAVVHHVATTNPRIRAIGETGLDHFRAGERGREVQREAFRAHLALAKELGLPLQIHDRDAHEAVVDTLLRDGAPERTVFHCFSGDAHLARVCAEHGWYLSIAGPVTFRANEDARHAVAAVPLELILVETDAPYLTPHPYRGRPNSPYLAPLTVREIARVRDEPLERVCAALSATSEELYGHW